MNRYFIYLTYNGTRFCGWQRQPNGLSVQQCLEEALSVILQRDLSVVGAGRTDAGVHARMMVAHFEYFVLIGDLLQLTDKLNRMLPKDIAVNKIVAVAENAHARFDAVSRTYKYCVTDKKNPFDYEWVCCMPLHNMDFNVMNKACKILFDYSDFTSFSKLHTDVKTNYCHIDEAEWERDGDVWVFTIRADRFLRNMVRAIVGTLWSVGRGKATVKDFRRIIEAKDRCKAGMSVPAVGLALVDIEYPEHLFLNS